MKTSARRITKVLRVVLAGIGMSVLSTHNAFSQAQVVPLTEQTPAGQSRPAGVPNDYVITPNGYFHASCVVEVKERETLRADGHIQRIDGSIENVPACGYPHYTGRGEIVIGAAQRGEIVAGATPPTISHSWIEYESTTTGASFGELTASWIVPPSPASNDGQTIYFFPGMEDSNNVISIIQPVLGYTGGAWSIASWNCCISGTTYHSSFLQVNPGNVILGTIRSTCAAGVLSCATWNITTEDETLGSSTTLSNSSSDGQTFNWAFAGVLEVYSVAQCSDYPPNGEIFFSNLALYDYNFNQISPGWSFTNSSSGLTPQCNYSGSVVSSAQVALDYTSGGGAITDTPVMTQGSNNATENGFTTIGADPIGSMNPGKTSNGYTYQTFKDVFRLSSGQYIQTNFVITGFTADPGQAWLTSAGCNGTTKIGASATYSYSAAGAEWVWTTGRMFGTDGNVNCTIVHK